MTEQNTPELRFPGINDRWESSTLNQITSILKDGTHGTHKDSKEGPWLLSAKNLKRIYFKLILLRKNSNEIK